MTEMNDPDISWRDGATPQSNQFGDIYFSPEHGLAESRHVFLKGIGAPEVWKSQPRFTIGELGFGTGLNFLTAWQMWRDTAPAAARLHYIGVEGYPLTQEDQRRALAAFPEIQELAGPLLAAMPPRRQGFHSINLDAGRVSLLLIYGDAEPSLNDLSASADAWYLDGFSPATNPAMWTAGLLASIAARSKEHTRVATFTSAGAVRRGLTAVGFNVERRTGFGTKRENQAGVFQGRGTSTPLPVWSRLPSSLSSPGRIAVVGAGIAGACAAGVLAKQGAKVTVFAGPSDDGLASATPAAVLQPRPLWDGSPTAAFFVAAFEQAIKTYDDLDGAWHQKGLLAFGRDDYDSERYRQLPFGTPATGTDTSDRTGVDMGLDGTWFAEAGVLNSLESCAAIAVDAAARLARTVVTLEPAADLWRITDDHGEIHEADAVVLACGMETTALSGFADLGLVPNRGQISFVAPNDSTQALRAAIMFGGYLTPPINGPGGAPAHVLGATFERRTDWPGQAWQIMRDDDHRRNLAVLADRLPELAENLGSITGGWTGLRATTPDRMPVIGPVPDRASYLRDYRLFHHWRAPTEGPAPTYRNGLYVLSGLGSRGFLTAPLAAEILASVIFGTPLPVPWPVWPLLHPARFLMRDLRKGRAG